MQKQAVIIYGPPGSGKGTQAELLARRYNFIHFDTGRYIESLVRAPGWEKSAVLRRERRIFDSGVLCTPSWVFKITAQFAGKMSKLGYSIVFSGSPRTLPEAFGTKDNGLAKVLERLYGKANIVVVQLQVSEKASLDRNSHRLVCSVCGLPLLSGTKIKNCAFCAGKMRTRSLDKPEVIKVRLKEYHNRTYPIIAGMKKRNFKVFPINGEPLPYKVFENVKKALKLK
ncbi:MAG: nucleoside monophosphate kinase [Patescibacteria group bacterium]